MTMQDKDAAYNFLNFLRGMETEQIDYDASAAPGFLNFLRGMETKRLHPLHEVSAPPS